MRDRLKLNFLTLVTATIALGVAFTGFAQTAPVARPAASAPRPAASAFVTIAAARFSIRSALSR
jgi:hypothetical protein